MRAGRRLELSQCVAGASGQHSVSPLQVAFEPFKAALDRRVQAEGGRLREPSRQLRARSRAGLRERLRQEVLHRALGDLQRRSDIFALKPARDELNDLSLASGER